MLTRGEEVRAEDEDGWDASVGILLSGRLDCEPGIWGVLSRWRAFTEAIHYLQRLSDGDTHGVTC